MMVLWVAPYPVIGVESERLVMLPRPLRFRALTALPLLVLGLDPAESMETTFILGVLSFLSVASSSSLSVTIGSVEGGWEVRGII